MKNNIENVPSEIFDWINSLSFEALHTDQQERVLQHFSKEEYHELFESNRNIQNALQQSKYHSGKEDLLSLFDEKHPEKKHLSFWKNDVLWKAASVLLLLSTLWFSLRNLKEKALTDTKVVVKYDTVFVEKESITTKSKEDILAERIRAKKSPSFQTPLKSPTSKIFEPARTSTVPETAYAAIAKPDKDFQILSLSTINSISNTTKRNSMQDDSLERNFKFVSL